METAQNAISPTPTLLGKCTGCSRPLPLRLPEIDEQALDWVCTHCGTSYRGVLLKDWPAEFRRNVRPVASQSEQGKPPNQSAAVADFTVEADSRRQPPISIAFPDHQGIRCELETAVSRQFDAQIARGESLRIQPQGSPFADEIRKHGDSPYDKRAVNRFRELVQQASGQVGELFTSFEAGDSAGVRTVESISRDGLFRVAEDIDLFVSLGLTPCSYAYPNEHALRVGMVAMSIGATLGWDERTLLDLGMGCLLHDAGMLGVDQAMYQSKRVLSPTELVEIAKHPLLTFGFLRRHLDLVPESALMVAYQVHERCNGTGYPRGYVGSQIHDLAKIAAVADVFVALVSPRPYRPGIVPYHALKKILNDTKAGLYDAGVVRGLLNTVALFPIGSYVTLNDGRVGRVIRAVGNQYTRPVIEAWRRQDPSATPSVIDLSAQQELRITNALAHLDD